MSGTVCIITARGGSKRIPRKNIRDFLGKPIMAYSIEAALKSGVFDEVMVSTDDEEIAAVAREYGAQVPFMRSAATANDYATTKDVLLEVLDEYEKRESPRRRRGLSRKQGGRYFKSASSSACGRTPTSLPTCCPS